MDCNGMKTSPDGMGDPSMMQKMMEKMCGKGEFSPAFKGMTAPAGRTAGTPAHAAPEVGKLFDDWVRGVEAEMLATLKAKGAVDLATLAGALEISPESALYFLGKLVAEGKAIIGSIQVAGGTDATT